MPYVRKKDGGYQVTWRLPNGERESRQSRLWTRREAERFGEERESELRRNPWAVSRSSQTPRFDAYASEWFGVRASRIKPSTRSKENGIESLVVETFGGFRLNEISPQVIRDFRDAQLARVSRGYVVDIFGLLRLIFAQAVEDRLITSTPIVSGIPRIGAVTARRAAAIPPHDAEAIAHAIEPSSRILTLTMIGTGARIGEAMALRVSDLDLDHQSLTISRTLSKDETSRVVVSEGGKTENAARTIKLPAWLVRDLREHLISLPNRDGWLFPSVEGNHLHPGNWRRRVWNPCVRSLGLDGVKPHGLRHLHASLLIAEGVPLPEIAKRMGHANSGVTLTVYGHMIPTDDSAAASAIPDFGVVKANL
jgi:integrase